LVKFAILNLVKPSKKNLATIGNLTGTFLKNSTWENNCTLSSIY